MKTASELADLAITEINRLRAGEVSPPPVNPNLVITQEQRTALSDLLDPVPSDTLPGNGGETLPPQASPQAQAHLKGLVR